MSDNLPWQEEMFHDWYISAMNHYVVNSVKYLYVNLTHIETPLSQSVKVEGLDDKELWKKLTKLVTDANIERRQYKCFHDRES